MTAKTAQLSVALPTDPVACGQTSPGLPTRLWGALTPASAEYISILSPHGPNYSGSIQLVDQAPPPSRSLQSAAPAGPRRPQQHVVEEFGAFARLAKVKKRRPVTPPWERDKRAWEAAKLVAQQQKKVKELEKTQRKRRKGGRFPPPSPGSGAGSSLGALLKRNVQKQIKIDNMKGKSIVQRCKSLRLPLRPLLPTPGQRGHRSHLSACTAPTLWTIAFSCARKLSATTPASVGCGAPPLPKMLGATPSASRGHSRRSSIRARMIWVSASTIRCSFPQRNDARLAAHAQL